MSMFEVIMHLGILESSSDGFPAHDVSSPSWWKFHHMEAEFGWEAFNPSIHDPGLLWEIFF